MSLKVKLGPLFLLRNWILHTHRNFTKNFLGRVLTIVDASISDKEQRKGIKDLIEDAFYNTYEHRYPDRELRFILFDWAEKYCPELSPKTDQDSSAFKGELESGKSRMKYFQEEGSTPEIN